MMDKNDAAAATSLAAFAIVYAMLIAIKRKGLLNNLEIQQLMDDALRGVEAQAQQGASIDAARQLLDETFAVLVPPLPPKSPTTARARAPRRKR